MFIAEQLPEAGARSAPASGRIEDAPPLRRPHTREKVHDEGGTRWNEQMPPPWHLSGKHRQHQRPGYKAMCRVIRQISMILTRVGYRGGCFRSMRGHFEEATDQFRNCASAMPPFVQITKETAAYAAGAGMSRSETWRIPLPPPSSSFSGSEQVPRRGSRRSRGGSCGRASRPRRISPAAGRAGTWCRRGRRGRRRNFNSQIHAWHRSCRPCMLVWGLEGIPKCEHLQQ